MSVFMKIYSILLINANRRTGMPHLTLNGMLQDDYDVTQGLTKAPCDLIVLFTSNDLRSDLQTCFVFKGIFESEDFDCNRTLRATSYEINATDNHLMHFREDDDRGSRQTNCSDARYRGYGDLRCKACVLTPSDYKILDNCSLSFSEKVYRPSTCQRESSEMREIEMLHISDGLHLVDNVLTSISIAALSLHIIIFCLMMDNRNLPGYNLASLSVALFIYYCLRMIGQIKDVSVRSCAVFVFLRLYFFLVSIFWMNVMAFDVWRALQLATSKLHVSSSKLSLSKFLLYALYAWGLPLLFISTALIVRNLKSVPDEYKLHVSRDQYCGFYTKKLLLIYYASPVFTVIFINGVFFVCITFIIINNSVSKESDQRFAAARRNFMLYVRLCVIMGMTWLIGVIGVFANSVELLRVAIVLNGSYGQFIFIFFTCNPKIWKNLREKFRQLQIQTVSANPTVSQ